METVRKPSFRLHWLMASGLAVMGLALVWWLTYYSQWQGPFGLLGVKFSCLTGDPFECATFREFIGPSSIPVYVPAIWWAGLISMLVGFYISRRNRI
ncbi:MAG: hypothetical protein JWR75_317 [Devosia sp.]|nr:hypothetical protein [Devosia sp.]